jgi:hypothetical protein
MGFAFTKKHVLALLYQFRHRHGYVNLPLKLRSKPILLSNHCRTILHGLLLY